jgi:hypothetical protein
MPFMLNKCINNGWKINLQFLQVGMLFSEMMRVV